MGLLLAELVTTAVVFILLQREFRSLERRRLERLRYRRQRVSLHIDVSKFNEAMKRAGVSVAALSRAFSRRHRADPLTIANQYRKGGLPHPHVVDARDYEEAP